MDLHQAFARLHPTQGTIVRFLALPPRLRPFQTLPLTPNGAAGDRFPYAFRLAPLSSP